MCGGGFVSIQGTPVSKHLGLALRAAGGRVLSEVGELSELFVLGEDVTRGAEDLDSDREADARRGEEQDDAVVGRVLDGGPISEGQPDQAGRFGSLAGHVPAGRELLRIPPRGEIDPGPAPAGHPASAAADGVGHP